MESVQCCAEHLPKRNELSVLLPCARSSNSSCYRIFPYKHFACQKCWNRNESCTCREPLKMPDTHQIQFTHHCARIDRRNYQKLYRFFSLLNHNYQIEMTLLRLSVTPIFPGSLSSNCDFVRWNSAVNEVQWCVQRQSDFDDNLIKYHLPQNIRRK